MLPFYLPLKLKNIFLTVFLLILLLNLNRCGPYSTCPLPDPFCNGPFALNTNNSLTPATTAYGPPWANVSTSSNQFIPCFGPYALCYYSECTEITGSNGTTVNCPCFDWFGTNYVLMNSILNLNVYYATVLFCTQNPDLCEIPNQAPVCEAINSGQFMRQTERISAFGFYKAAQEPIGFTDCSNEPGVYAGCMTSPCFGPITPTSDSTAMIDCTCPTWDGPFQIGQDNLACNISPFVYSASYNPTAQPPSKCNIIQGCIPDAPEEDCGCPLYTSTTTLPSNSGINCNLVCEEYNSCKNSNNVELGYTCDATICTSDNHDLVFEACNGLQYCDLSEIFKAEKAAQCSCCGSQLCNCESNSITNHKIQLLNTEQINQGETPQCEINGTLCGS